MAGRKKTEVRDVTAEPTKAGRPKMSKGTARTDFIGLKASTEQKTRWDAARKVEGEPLSTFLATAGDERADRILGKRKK